MKFRSLVWAPTISLSWFWGLGFFYSIHATLTYGWLGFVGTSVFYAFAMIAFFIAISMIARSRIA